MPHTPQGEEALQLQPVEVFLRGDLAGEVFEFVTLELVVFKIGLTASGQQGCFGLEVFAHQRLESLKGLSEGRVEGLGTRLTFPALAVPGQHNALGQQALVLGVDDFVADAEPIFRN